MGKGFCFLWGNSPDWITSKGLDVGHNNTGYTINECDNDPLWQEFQDLLPYMDCSSVVTKMPPGGHMVPHVDRRWRSKAIYIPIEGCSEQCVSKIYDMPIDTDTQVRLYKTEFPKDSLYQYSIVDQPYLTNTHVWHSVQNFSDMERTTFGWNFKSAEYGFEQCKQILSDLGYIK